MDNVCARAWQHFENLAPVDISVLTIILVAMAPNLSRQAFNKFGYKFWPRYRGKRAGQAVRAREQLQRCRIEIIQPRQVKRRIYKNVQNSNNCIEIPLKQSSANCSGKRSTNTFVPSFFLSNVMSLAPKIDEVRHVVYKANFDFICITESWLKPHI